MTMYETVEAARTALNSEAGQALTEKLIEQVKQQNPEITMKDWKEIQARFLAYMTIKMAQEVIREGRTA